MAFGARKIFGTSEKHATGRWTWPANPINGTTNKNYQRNLNKDILTKTIPNSLLRFGNEINQ